MTKNTIQVACIKANLKKIREFVGQVLESHQLNAVDINLLVLAVDELCANLMIHSHGCNPEEEIEVCVEKSDEQLIFEVRDINDTLFNLKNYKIPEIQSLIKERKGGGIGLILVKRIADEIECEKRDKVNIYRFFKRFNSLSSSHDTTNATN
ncbi:MAG: ATP-binding protein [Bacteroidota bacterium]